MIDTEQFGLGLKQGGYDFFSGVPCSSLKHLINYAINECDYIAAANEGDAVAICSGAVLGGRKSVVLFQNSGLTNAVSPLTSLNACFRIPVLGFVSLRGEPGTVDEPQHELMGKITAGMLDLMTVETAYLSDRTEEALEQLKLADAVIETGKPFFFIVRRGCFSPVTLCHEPGKPHANTVARPEQKRPVPEKRLTALDVINRLAGPETVLLAATGKTGRELFEIEDRPGNLYMVGSMGCISSLGLGIALACPQRQVIAIDGDGALLMRMGCLTTNALYRPDNLLHIVLDNNAYDSTGGQFTASFNADFVRIAAASGYPAAVFAHDPPELEACIAEWQQSPVLTFIHMKIKPGSKKDLSRPVLKPFEIKERLIDFLSARMED